MSTLVKGEVERPSDYDGDDSGGWQFALVRELRAAGFEVTMNDAL